MAQCREWPEPALRGFGVLLSWQTAWLCGWPAGEDQVTRPGWGSGRGGPAVTRKADPTLRTPRVRYPPPDPVPESARPRRGGRVRPTKCVNLGCHERECPRLPLVRGVRWRATTAGSAMSDGPGTTGTSLVPRPVAARLRRRPPFGRHPRLDRRLVLLLMAGVLVFAGLV